MGLFTAIFMTVSCLHREINLPVIHRVIKSKFEKGL